MAQHQLQQSFGNNVPPWLSEEYSELTSVQLRYENQIYGFLNSFSIQAFKPGEGFMVTPQGLLRGIPYAQLVAAGIISTNNLDGQQQGPDDFETPANISIDAIDGYVVISRAVPGHEQDFNIADFLIYKFIPPDQRTNFYEKFVLVAIIEAKRSDATLRESEEQLRKYMKHAGQRQNSEQVRPIRQNRPPVLGVLLSTESFYTFNLQSHQAGALADPTSRRRYSNIDGGQTLWGVLRAHAEAWL